MIVDQEMADALSTCSVDACQRVATSRGWCRLHYKQWQRTGGHGMSQDTEMHDVLIALEMLASGAVTNFDATGAGGVADSKPPAGVRFDGSSELPLHAYWHAKYERAVGHYQREQVYNAARAELDAFKKRPKITIVMETEEELEGRIVKEGQGWTVEQVAIHCRCTTTFARRARLRAGVSVTTGTAPASLKVPLQRSERAAKARKMRNEDGMTIRQIAMFLKCDPMTVHRDLAA